MITKFKLFESIEPAMIKVSDVFNEFKSKEDRLKELRRLLTNKIIDLETKIYSESEMKDLTYKIKNLKVLGVASEPETGYEYKILFFDGTHTEVKKDDVYVIKGDIGSSRRFSETDPFGEEDWEINEKAVYPPIKVGDRVVVKRDIRGSTFKAGERYIVDGFLFDGEYVKLRTLDKYWPGNPPSIEKGRECWCSWHISNFESDTDEARKIREKIRDKMKDIDPLGEEDWLNENQSEVDPFEEEIWDTAVSDLYANLMEVFRDEEGFYFSMAYDGETNSIEFEFEDENFKIEANPEGGFVFYRKEDNKKAETENVPEKDIFERIKSEVDKKLEFYIKAVRHSADQANRKGCH
jgi:hypothetical protein